MPTLSYLLNPWREVRRLQEMNRDFYTLGVHRESRLIRARVERDALHSALGALLDVAEGTEPDPEKGAQAIADARFIHQQTAPIPQNTTTQERAQ